MNPIVELSSKVMEKGIPRVHNLMNGIAEEGVLTTIVDYVYNPFKGHVLEIWSHGSFDPGKNYHIFVVKTPLPFTSENYSEITDYHPPEGTTLEARQNLEDAVRLWNERHGYSHVMSR